MPCGEKKERCRDGVACVVFLYPVLPVHCDLREGNEYRPSGRYYTLQQAAECMLVDNCTCNTS